MSRGLGYYAFMLFQKNAFSISESMMFNTNNVAIGGSITGIPGYSINSFHCMRNSNTRYNDTTGISHRHKSFTSGFKFKADSVTVYTWTC